MVVSLPVSFLVLRLRGLVCVPGRVLVLGGTVGGSNLVTLVLLRMVLLLLVGFLLSAWFLAEG